jgi:hypothetical protein
MSENYKKIMHEINFAEFKSKYIDKFCNVKDYIMTAAVSDDELASLILKNGKAGVQSALSLLEKKFTEGKTIVNGLKENDAVLPESTKAFAFIKKLKCVEHPSYSELKFTDALSEVFNIYQYRSRGVHINMYNVQVSGDSVFQLRDLLNSYGGERYCIAFSNTDFSVSIVVQPSDTGVMGATEAFLYVCEDAHIYIERLGKYIDATALCVGVH